MYQWSADSIVVVIKLYAYENMVTYLRIKHKEIIMEDEAKD